MSPIVAPHQPSVVAGARTSRRASPSALQRLNKALQRAALAARQPAVSRIVAATALDALLAAATGMAFLVQGVILGGVFVLACFIGLHVANVARGNALYGPLGPPIEPGVLPHELRVVAVRTAYEAVLRAHQRVRGALRMRHDPLMPLLSLYDRCRQLVLLAGRVAAVGNTVAAYLDEHDHDPLDREVHRLRVTAAGTHDLQARQALRQTVETRLQQQRGIEEVRALLDRIQARVELIAASLELVHAFTIKVHARFDEQAAYAADDGFGLELLRGELDFLEAAMEEALLGPDETEISLVADAIECVASLDYVYAETSGAQPRAR